MILVRDIFQLKFGRAKEAVELFKSAQQEMNDAGMHDVRFLTDLTGQYYTFVMESTFDNLTEYENAFHKEMTNDQWHKIYKKFVELVESGRREIFTIVDIGRRSLGERNEQKVKAEVYSGRTQGNR
jgi:hypothetical protein